MTECGGVGPWILLYISLPPPILENLFTQGPPAWTHLKQWIWIGDGAPDMDEKMLVVGLRVPVVFHIGGELHHAQLLGGDAPALPGRAARLRAHSHTCREQKYCTCRVQKKICTLHVQVSKRHLLAAEFQIRGFSHWPNRSIYIICNEADFLLPGRPSFKSFTLFFKLYGCIIDDFHIHRQLFHIHRQMLKKKITPGKPPLNLARYLFKGNV